MTLRKAATRAKGLVLLSRHRAGGGRPLVAVMGGQLAC
jgi:hypothetical protein